MSINGEHQYIVPGSEASSLIQRPEGRERVWLFLKEGDEPLSCNFFLREFHCRCHGGRCQLTLAHPKLVEVLQTLRELVARPLILSSGFRCAGFNRTVGGRARSFHTRGMAADVVCPELSQVEELAGAAERIDAIGGIGLYPLRRFVHIDVRPRQLDGSTITWNG